MATTAAANDHHNATILRVNDNLHRFYDEKKRHNSYYMFELWNKRSGVQPLEGDSPPRGNKFHAQFELARVSYYV